MDAPKVGLRLKCETCGSEAIITKLGEPVLTCCGAAPSEVSPPGAKDKAEDGRAGTT